MRSRAHSALVGLFDISSNPAIAALTDFAAQNSGMDPRNYFSDWRDKEGRKAYRGESRAVSNDWKEYKRALSVASTEQVTDADVIEAAPRAFSGRLEWNAGKSRWDYTTGQYFPTEYRKAAKAVLWDAIYAVRRARPAVEAEIFTIADLKAVAEKNGSHWFERGSMKFFGTRIESGILKGRYFITSEQPPHGPRAYSVRSFDKQGNVDTVGEFCGFTSKREAMEAVPV